ncbi:MAG TPA: sodium:solute symporter [Hyphomicrobium sp.]|nr:sodium:solute symporter [Hyphomicrobium sp.]
MTFSPRSRLVNPRLGTYFSIFAALFVAAFLLDLILEQLKFGDGTLRIAMLLVPFALYAAIGLSTATQDVLGFFAAGRRVPSGYTGLILAMSATGATFLVAAAGAFFFAGFDALVLLIGGLSGFVVMAMVLAPFYRKFGAYTVPSYFGRRFESKILRIATAMIAAVPILLVLAAELRLGAEIGAQLSGIGVYAMVFILIAMITMCVAPGGKRSFTWTGVAQSIAMLLALMIAATAVAVLVTSLPVPQLTHGPLVRGLVRNEVAQGLQLIQVSPFAFELPHDGFQTITKPYTQPFGAIGPLGFASGVIMIACGIAAAPWLLPRVAAAPGVYEARKSLGWATVFFGFAILTVSSVAVFMRDFVLDSVMADRVGPLPQWLYTAAAQGFVQFDQALSRLTFSALQFERDSVLFALPIAADLPQAFVYLLMAGGIAASLIAAGATTVSLAAILGEDVVQGLSWEPASSENRVWISRVFVAIAACCGGIITLLAPTDPLRLVLWALSLTAASLFPIMVLSIWWKRLTSQGALLGMVSGFGVAAFAIFASEAELLVIPSVISGSFGMPIAAGVALAISALRPEANRHDLEVVRDIRVPGGQIIYDREMQRLQLQKHART